MNPDERIRRRLESLNRGPLPADAMVVRRPTALPNVQHAPPHGSATAAVRTQQRRDLVKPIPGLIRRGKAIENEAGEHLLVQLEIDELWPRGEQLVARRHERLLAASSADVANSTDVSDALVSDDMRTFLAAFPDKALLLDLETCGLAGSALFLVGLLRQVDGRLAVELLLARDYSEERAVLASLWNRVAAANMVVTYNGKSFDWPMVLDRSARHLLRPDGETDIHHVDLLHAARRRWKRELPDCKLQTIEEHVCGRQRRGDIPGAQIPSAYKEYVRTGFTRDLDAILLHNAVDLVTLLDVAMRITDASPTI